MTRQAHWERVYSSNPPDKVGWYTPHLQISLQWIKECSLSRGAPIIDVGGGASTLVDDLLAEGYRSITVLDLSGAALAVAKKRLGEKAKAVTWLEGDITDVDLPAAYYDLWHDRAVFHFLTAPEDRRQYLSKLSEATKPGSHLLIATFSPEAPPRCSGLPVERYSADDLGKVLGSRFELKRQRHELHITPGGVEQMYLYCHFERIA
ncbi:MAG TPA: class I SAM-dependent methyltransferase [Gammaproteobacteria bacterium]|nr:class I SAM-dependent methyltransferase [Gammaproteobacteria bacterium]